MATKAVSRNEDRNGAEENATEAKDGDVTKAIQSHRAINKVTDTTCADERFAAVTDKPAENHARRNVPLQLYETMRGKSRHQ